MKRNATISFSGNVFKDRYLLNTLSKVMNLCAARNDITNSYNETDWQ